jgi:parallel beta-helix repeat protein
MSTVARISLLAVAILFFSASSLAVTIVSDCANLDTANEYYLLNTTITNAVAPSGITDYGGCFNITADNITLDCAWFTVDGDGDEDGNGVYVSNATKGSLYNITVTNCTITQFRNGIRARNVSFSHFYHNNLSGNAGSGVAGTHAGISASNMTDSWVTYSNFTANADYGLFLLYSDRNNITQNRVTNTDDSTRYGIALQASTGNRIWNNTVSSNDAWGIIVMLASNANAILNNTLNSNVESGLWVYNSSDTIVRNNTIRANTGTYGGILCTSEANRTRIDNNTIVANSGGNGIYIMQSSNVMIDNNTISSNEDYAIRLATNSTVIIRRNLVCMNEDGFLSNASGTTHTTQNNTMCIYDMLPANDTTVSSSSLTFSAMANPLETMSCDLYVDSDLKIHVNAAALTNAYTMTLSSRDKGLLLVGCLQRHKRQ